MLRLRRITSGASWIPQIDGLRFIAIFAVLLGHAFQEVIHRGLHPFVIDPGSHWVTYMLANSARGVHLFFVISGYILARPFLRQHRMEGHKVKLGAYFWRRITRLEPPYLLSLLLYTVAIVLVFHPRFRELLPHLLASIGYIHRYIYNAASTINGVTWSLEVDIQFYILAPFLGNIFRIKNTPFRRCILTALVLFFCFINGRPLPFPYYVLTPIVYMQYFLSGFLLTDLLEYPRHTSRQAWGWDLVSLAGWPAIFLVGGSAGGITPAWLPLLIIPVYLAAFYGKASNYFFRHPLVALTGGMCYSIYLMHMLVFSTSFRAIKYVRLPWDAATITAQMALLTALALGVSTIYFVLVERPCMDPEWPRKLWRKVHRPEDEKTVPTVVQ